MFTKVEGYVGENEFSIHIQVEGDESPEELAAAYLEAAKKIREEADANNR